MAGRLGDSADLRDIGYNLLMSTFWEAGRPREALYGGLAWQLFWGSGL